MQTPRFHDLELVNVEQTLESFESSLKPAWEADEPDDGQLHEMQADFLSDLVSSCDALELPIADERQIYNFIARLLRVMRTTIAVEDAEWLAEMSTMVYRMQPSAPVLEAALAFLYANSDNTAPKPKEVYAAIANCQGRVTELRHRVEAIATLNRFCRA